LCGNQQINILCPGARGFPLKKSHKRHSGKPGEIPKKFLLRLPRETPTAAIYLRV
jgi:hypothetical protein